jgi:hypothetical protein
MCKIEGVIEKKGRKKEKMEGEMQGGDCLLEQVQIRAS